MGWGSCEVGAGDCEVVIVGGCPVGAVEGSGAGTATVFVPMGTFTVPGAGCAFAGTLGTPFCGSWFGVNPVVGTGTGIASGGAACVMFCAGGVGA